MSPIWREVSNMPKVRWLVRGRAGSESNLWTLVQYSFQTPLHWFSPLIYFPASINLYDNLLIVTSYVLLILFYKTRGWKSMLRNKQANKWENFYCLYPMIHHSTIPGECSLILYIMTPFTKLNKLFWGTIYWSKAHLPILPSEDLTASQTLRLGNPFTQQLSQWHDKREVARHLLLNELLSFLRMHMHEVQLRRHWPPERINIPDIGLWWDHTKTKEMITLLTSFLFRSNKSYVFSNGFDSY